MACDYDLIRRENEGRYGTDIGRIGHLLLADRYDDRTHFIYELLQNAEDALARRTDWEGSRTVSFELDASGLHVSHFGVPFDEGDVRGVCGIAESTKDLTAIGRFGIGFKSVYALSSRPEVHSGAESFAIENFVWPVATDPVERRQDETVIRIPLQTSDEANKTEIADGLRRLGTTSLLFLREITEIRWSVGGTPVGLYLRDAEQVGPGVRLVTVVGEKQGTSEVNDEWLVFSRPVCTGDGQLRGNVELAWLTAKSEDGRRTVRAVKRSPLVVFFPTVVETGLGFLIQGPYRTTPSRDNVPPRDEWNRKCVQETGALLIDSLRWLRDQGLLDAPALSCLPLEPDRFEESMFRELFEKTKNALEEDELLPTDGGTYASARDCCLARSEALQELLSPGQLADLHSRTRPLRWLHSAISQNKTPELCAYLLNELGIREVRPDAFLRRLKDAAPFFEKQTDEWIQDLYKFLGSQPALRPRVASLPIVRRKDGSHVSPTDGDGPSAFLPGPLETSFPTVRAAVCRTGEARQFLESLGLTEPDPVDDVILNVLPKYRTAEKRASLSEAEYSLDVNLMLGAAKTDSQAQQKKLAKALGGTRWVRVVDGSGSRGLWAEPGDVYIATGRLQRLFEGIGDVLLVDAGVTCLKGEEVRGLLEGSGATRHLRSVAVDCDLTQEQRTEIRRNKGLERATWSTIEDSAIRGLGAVLDKLEVLDPAERAGRARDLWGALTDLAKRRGSQSFDATYMWRFMFEEKRAAFDPAFVRMLNKRRWVPDSSGNLHRPDVVAFEDTGWEPNSLMQSKIRFKPPLLEQLARAVGIESGVLALLKALGVKSEADLRKQLVIRNDPPVSPTPDDGPSPDRRTRPNETHEPEPPGDESEPKTPETEEPPPGKATPRRFISYLSVAHEDEDADSDGLAHSARMELERLAIDLILELEPSWQRTPVNNPGFDLYRGATMDGATHWCEVKAMAGTLNDRPVGMSSCQFEWARTRGDHCWLYVVERVGTSDVRVVRIQDPAGKAKTFTFDHGWRSIAE